MRTDRKQLATSVKLFPRLATKRNRIHPPHRLAGRNRPDAAASVDSLESRRTVVRARLLRMILDNEETRRNDRRPTAG
jgi:hypothetical protein